MTQIPDQKEYPVAEQVATKIRTTFKKTMKHFLLKICA